MKTSKRKLAANRANAQKSTGPATPEAKEKVAQNPIRHGLTGKFTVLANEPQATYDRLVERYLETEKPVDDIERDLVVNMARATWLSERAVRCQDACFLVQPVAPENAAKGIIAVAVRSDLDLYVRYYNTHLRAYQRFAAELAKRRKERQLLERGIASQKRQEAADERREAEEDRREQQHEWREERHHAAVAMDQKRREYAHMRNIQLGYDVSELFRGLPPEEIALFADTTSPTARQNGADAGKIAA